MHRPVTTVFIQLVFVTDDGDIGFDIILVVLIQEYREWRKNQVISFNICVILLETKEKVPEIWRFHLDPGQRGGQHGKNGGNRKSKLRRLD